MNAGKTPQDEIGVVGVGLPSNVAEPKRGYSSWWYWRKPGAGGVPNEKQLKLKEDEQKVFGELNAVGTQTSRSHTPIDGTAIKITDDDSKLNLTGKSDLSDLNKSQELMEDVHGEMYRKSLRLTSEQIVINT